MVGNDVVDLDDSETSEEELNPRFDQRVLSGGELRRMAVAGDPRTLRWTLWAAKESAYKLFRRSTPTAVFAHSLFETVLDDHGCTTVRHGEWSCAVAVSREGPAIHAIATPDRSDRARVISGVNKIPAAGDSSLLVRQLVMTSIAGRLGVDPAMAEVTTGSDHIPMLRINGLPRGFLSLSHHGALVAFAWMSAP